VNQALQNDAIRSFLLFQVLLLAIMLFAVIRLPPYTPSKTTEENRPAPPRPSAVNLAPGRPLSAPASAWPHGVPDGATYAQYPPVGVAAHSGPEDIAGQSGRTWSGRTKYVARHVATPEPRTIRRPKVSGAPPWGPAPRPPGYLP
jgi:hypothetical protein